MYAKEFRGTAEVYMDPLNFPPHILEIVKNYLFDEQEEWEDFLCELEEDTPGILHQFGLTEKSTKSNAFKKDGFLELVMDSGNGWDGVIVVPENSNDKWVDFITSSDLVSGGAYIIGVFNGKSYFLIQAD